MNTEIRILGKNLSAQFLGELISKILSFLLIIILARRLGVQDFGVYSFTLAFTTLFLTIGDFGTGPLLPREIARGPEDAPEFLTNITFLRLVGNTLLLTLAVAMASVLGYPSETVLLIVFIGVAKMLGNVAGVAQGILTGFERMEYSRGAKVTERLVTTTTAIVGVLSGFGIIFVGYAFIIGGIFQVLVAFVALLRINRSKDLDFFGGIRIDIGYWKSLLREAAPFIATTLFHFVYFDIDTIMISVMLGQTEVGSYSSAYRLMTVFSIISGSLVGAIYPAMSRYYSTRESRFQSILDKSLKILLAIALPLAAGTVIVAPEVVPLVYGDGYDQAVPVIQVLIWTQVAIFQNQLFSQAIAAMDKQDVEPLNTGTLAVFNVVVNFALIPVFGIVGAAIATVATEFLGVGLRLYWIQRFSQVPQYQDLSKVLISMAVMAGSVFALSQLNLNVFLIILGGAVIFLLILMLLGGINEDEVQIFRRLFESE